MTETRRSVALALGLGLVATTAFAQSADKVRIGLIQTLSGPAATLGQQARDGGAILISANAGPSSYAGKECHPNFFVTSYQNDQVHEVLGKVAQNRGYKKVYLLAPNYQAGRDSMAGFKRHFKGEIVEESYVPLNNLDFQSEL